MMLYPPMNQLTANVPNRYLLVNVVARRARQIAQEAEDAGEKLDVKPVTLAIQEVADGKLSVAAADIVITDVEGGYVINLTTDNPILVFSFIGFKTIEVPVGGRSVIDQTLQEDSQDIDEVVVVGYGTQKIP